MRLRINKFEKTVNKISHFYDKVKSHTFLLRPSPKIILRGWHITRLLLSFIPTSCQTYNKLLLHAYNISSITHHIVLHKYKIKIKTLLSLRVINESGLVCLFILYLCLAQVTSDLGAIWYKRDVGHRVRCF